MSLSIERVRDLDYEDFVRSHLEPRRPVVLVDAAKNWPALQWTPDYFRRELPKVRVDGSADAARTRQLIGKRVYTMAEFADAVERSTPEDPGPYMTGFPVRSIPKLLQDVTPVHKYLQNNWLDSPMMPAPSIDLLFGPADKRLPYLHKDRCYHHSFTTQTYGTKRFLFYPPEHEKFMYPRDGELFCKSWIDDPENPDLEKYPLFDQATRLTCDLTAGETLFIPAGWWHFTRTLSVSINFRHCYVDWSNYADVVSAVKRRIRERGALAPIGGAPVDSPRCPSGVFLLALLAVGRMKPRTRRIGVKQTAADLAVPD